MQILSQEEIDPPMTGDLKPTDVEDGDEAEVTVSAVVEEVQGNACGVPRKARRVLHPARCELSVYEQPRCRLIGWCWGTWQRGLVR